MKMRVKYKGRIVSENIIVADTLSTRLIGLMFRKKPDGDGLLLDPCNSIHTFFMRYSLDIAFLNNNNKVVKIIRNLQPWRLTWIYFSAKKTLEMPAGSLPQDLLEGDLLEVEHV